MTEPSFDDGTTTPPPDPERLIRFWQAHARPGEVYEIRIPKPKRGGPRRFWGVVGGYFDDPAAVERELATISGYDATGVYCSVNPVLADLLARANNRLVPTDISTSDDEVPVLHRMLVDVDARHPKGVCSTDAERDAAIKLRDELRCFLRDELGWPEPEKLLRTGNGAALHYMLDDLSNTPDHVTLLRRGLAALAALYAPKEHVASAFVDPTTFNPSRITRVPGTVNALGDGTVTRPWRLATAAYNPAPDPVMLHQLQALAALVPDPAGESPPPRRAEILVSVTPPRSWDIREVLRQADIGFREKTYAGGLALRLDRCLTSAEHIDGAAIIEMASGAIAYRCHHASCAGKGWTEARQVLPIPRTPGPGSCPSGRPAPFRGFELRDGKVVTR